VNKGLSLLNHYNQSLIAAICNIYNHIRWQPWFFEVPSPNPLFFTPSPPSIASLQDSQKGFWALPVNQRRYVDWLAEQLQIRCYKDWYRVKLSDIELRFGHTILKYHSHSLFILLSSAYPEMALMPWKFDLAKNEFWKNDDHYLRMLLFLEVPLSPLACFTVGHDSLA